MWSGRARRAAEMDEEFDMSVRRSRSARFRCPAGGGLDVTFRVTNTGRRAGDVGIG